MYCTHLQAVTSDVARKALTNLVIAVVAGGHTASVLSTCSAECGSALLTACLDGSDYEGLPGRPPSVQAMPW